MATYGLTEYADASPEVRAIYDDIMATRKIDWINNFWKAIAHDPALLKRTWDSIKQIMAPGELDPLVKEMLYVAVSVTNGCGYCIASHTASARKQGMTPAMFHELMSVVGMANETNRLANGYQVEIDDAFKTLVVAQSEIMKARATMQPRDSMRLEIQNAVLDLVSEVTGCPIQRKTAPDWMMRPGKVECGERWPLVCQIYRELTDSQLRDVMPEKERRQVDGILKCATCGPRIIEYDESQHFNRHRGLTLRLYPTDLRLAFDRKIWIEHSQAEPRQKSGGFAAPKPPLFPNEGGRHLQRAFRDALADILPPLYGFQPTLRIAYFEVKPWINTNSARKQMEDLLNRKIPKRDTTETPPE